jgi:hypothetical protein
MKLTCSGSKNSPKYYIQKTVRINGKSTTKTIEKLGGFDELKQRFCEVEPITKAKDYVKKLTLKEYQRNIRQSQIERAKKIVEQPSYLKKKNINSPKRFVDELHFTNTGEVASKTITSLKQSQIDEEARYDGFYCVCTNVEQDIEKILKINQKIWEIEECFRIMKHELKARPIYLSREDRILAHFTTCFIALIVYRILEKKLNETFTCTDTIKTLRDMNMMIIPGYGYIPIYKRTAITDALHEIFKFRTDYQIITQKDMRKILNITKKGEK